MTQQRIPLTEEELSDFSILDSEWNNIIYEMGILKIEELELQQKEFNLEMKKNDLVNHREKLLESMTIKYGPGVVNIMERCFIPHSDNIPD